MSTSSEKHNITRAIHNFKAEDEASKNELFNLVYDDLVRIASFLLMKFPAIETISADDLVAELYPKLLKRPNLLFLKNRDEFFRYTHRIMFNKLYDYKRGKRFKYKFYSYDKFLGRLGFEESFDDEEMQLLLKYIEKLAESGDGRKARIATVASRRLFEGTSRKELAAMYDVDVKTITRDWKVFVSGWRQFRSSLDKKV